MARVVVFEDNRDWQSLYEQLLKIDGHVVIGRATTIDEAKELIHNLGPKAFDVGLVDGNLSSGATNGDEGAAIAKLLQTKFSDVLVIGISVDGRVANTHYNVRKGSNPQAINKIIATAKKPAPHKAKPQS